MDADFISYETMLATKDASNWAFWAMIASVVSALSAVITIVLAAKALNTWHKQEALKVKVNFKYAILELESALDAMPDNWSYLHVNVARSILSRYPEITPTQKEEVGIYFKKNDLISAHSLALKSWLMCEGLFNASTVKNNWRDFNALYKDYIMRGGDKMNLEPFLKKITNDLKLF